MHHWYLIALLIAILILVPFIPRGKLAEGFEPEAESGTGTDTIDEIYAKLYSHVYDNPALYNEDVRVVKDTLKTLAKDNLRILDAGCGVGFHYERLAPQYEVVGVDRSENMLRWARIRTPSGVFINRSLADPSVAKKGEFDAIVCFLDGFYHNSPEVQKEIMKNFALWLDNGGYLIMHVFNRAALDPGPKEYSQYYKDEAGQRHASTYFDKFRHDAWWDVKGDGSAATINETFILRNNKKQKYSHTLYLPTKDELIAEAEAAGFKLNKIVPLKALSIHDFEIIVFRKLEKNVA